MPGWLDGATRRVLLSRRRTLYSHRRNDTRRGLGGGPSRWPDTRSRGDRMFKSIKNRTLVCAWIAVAFLWSAGVHADDQAGRSRWVGTWATGLAGPAGP